MANHDSKKQIKMTKSEILEKLAALKKDLLEKEMKLEKMNRMASKKENVKKRLQQRNEVCDSSVSKSTIETFATTSFPTKIDSRNIIPNTNSGQSNKEDTFAFQTQCAIKKTNNKKSLSDNKGSCKEDTQTDKITALNLKKSDDNIKLSGISDAGLKDKPGCNDELALEKNRESNILTNDLVIDEASHSMDLGTKKLPNYSGHSSTYKITKSSLSSKREKTKKRPCGTKRKRKLSPILHVGDSQNITGNLILSPEIKKFGMENSYPQKDGNTVDEINVSSGNALITNLAKSCYSTRKLDLPHKNHNEPGIITQETVSYSPHLDFHNLDEDVDMYSHIKRRRLSRQATRKRHSFDGELIRRYCPDSLESNVSFVSPSPYSQPNGIRFPHLAQGLSQANGCIPALQNSGQNSSETVTSEICSGTSLQESDVHLTKKTGGRQRLKRLQKRKRKSLDVMSCSTQSLSTPFAESSQSSIASSSISQQYKFKFPEVPLHLTQFLTKTFSLPEEDFADLIATRKSSGSTSVLRSQDYTGFLNSGHNIELCDKNDGGTVGCSKSEEPIVSPTHDMFNENSNSVHSPEKNLDKNIVPEFISSKNDTRGGIVSTTDEITENKSGTSSSKCSQDLNSATTSVSSSIEDPIVPTQEGSQTQDIESLVIGMFDTVIQEDEKGLTWQNTVKCGNENNHIIAASSGCMSHDGLNSTPVVILCTKNTVNTFKCDNDDSKWRLHRTWTNKCDKCLTDVIYLAGSHSKLSLIITEIDGESKLLSTLRFLPDEQLEQDDILEIPSSMNVCCCVLDSMEFVTSAADQHSEIHKFSYLDDLQHLQKVYDIEDEVHSLLKISGTKNLLLCVSKTTAYIINHEKAVQLSYISFNFQVSQCLHVESYDGLLLALCMHLTEQTGILVALNPMSQRSLSIHSLDNLPNLRSGKKLKTKLRLKDLVYLDSKLVGVTSRKRRAVWSFYSGKVLGVCKDIQPASLATSPGSKQLVIMSEYFSDIYSAK